MPTHIALLRGITVGGRNRVAMAGLCQVVLGLGYTDVATYIQSSNVVFASEEADTAMIAAALERGSPNTWACGPRSWSSPAQSWRGWRRTTPCSCIPPVASAAASWPPNCSVSVVPELPSRLHSPQLGNREQAAGLV
jgi:hypothetical protein